MPLHSWGFLVVEATGERLARLLALVTYLAENGSVAVTELADHFGVSPAQVLRDVDTLWVSGTPGYQPDDLLDFDLDDDESYVSLTNARGMDRPLRLGPGEAVALLVALRAVAQLPGMSGSSAVASALEKLTAAAGDAAQSAEAIVLADGDRALDSHVTSVLASLRKALASNHRVALTYVSVADERTFREVDPLELLNDGATWFLRGWCYRAGDVRNFRLDRIASIQATEQAIEAHDVADGTASIRPSSAALRARLVVTPRTRHVAERYAGDIVAEGEDHLVIELDVADTAWLARLVLDLGPEVIELEPQDVAESIALRARAALAAYGEVV